MTNTSLAQSYLVKALKRLKILAVLLDDDSHSDLVREAQEIVKLALKGMLRQVGVEPPKKREFSFCGDVDFIPTEEYARADAAGAIEDARFVVSVAESVLPVG
jgi:HEPN domain-containing protein